MEKELRTRTYVERGGGFWAGDREDCGYLSEAERIDLASEAGVFRVSVDPEDHN